MVNFVVHGGFSFACGETERRAGWFASLTRYAPSVRDILVMQARYYSAMQNSDIFATRNMFRVANVVESTLFINPHAAQFAAYRAAGISLAIGQISQIREDLYRFSLSALSDKLNFPHGS